MSVEIFLNSASTNVLVWFGTVQSDPMFPKWDFNASLISFLESSNSRQLFVRGEGRVSYFLLESFTFNFAVESFRKSVCDSS